jgi:photosystem II stability/assembly factor-like uncharacterized protein
LSWFVSDTPMVRGTAGSGIFSIAMFDSKNGVIVGGNYEKPNETTNNLAFTTDGGKTWASGKGLTGYRSGVAYINKKTIIAVGSGSYDYSFDGGKTWRNDNTAGVEHKDFNAVQAKGKNAVWAVGGGGLVARFTGDETAVTSD